MGSQDVAEPELPMPAMCVQEESLFDVTDETIDARLLFLGLDNAGKTTLLQMLKNDRMVAQVPTLHPQTEELIIDKVRYKAFDLAGHETGRRIWKDYFTSAGAIVFMVDSADRTRFPEAAEELAHLLKDPALEQVCIAVIGTKVDMKEASSEEEFRAAMGVNASSLPSGRSVKVFMCSLVEKRGYADAIKWIQEYLLAHHVQIPANAPVATANVGCNQDEEDMMV